MVATTTEEQGKPMVAEVDCTTATTPTSKTNTITTPKMPSPLEISVQSEEQVPDERSDDELSPRADRDNDDTVKYGFGAGMRMYAKSLAMAEKQEATPVKKSTAVRKVKPVEVKPVVVKQSLEEPALSPNTSTLSPKAASPKVQAAASPKVQATASPKVQATASPSKVQATASPKAAVTLTLSEPPVIVDPPAMETVPMTPAAVPATTEVKSVAASPAVATTKASVDNEVAALPTVQKSIACGNIFLQVQEFFGEFFRKTEEIVDDCHERVRNRETVTCASTAMKTVASSELEDNEMVEPPEAATATAVVNDTTEKEGETAAAPASPPSA